MKNFNIYCYATNLENLFQICEMNSWTMFNIFITKIPLQLILLTPTFPVSKAMNRLKNWTMKRWELKFAKLRASYAFVPYAPHVPTCLTCLRAFVPFLLTCLPFFTCLTWLHFCTCFTCFYFFMRLTCLHILRVLRALIFYYMP